MDELGEPGFHYREQLLLDSCSNCVTIAFRDHNVPWPRVAIGTDRVVNKLPSTSLVDLTGLDHTREWS